MASAIANELVALFNNGQVPEPIHMCLDETSYPQPNTLLKTDNSITIGIINSFIWQKNSKAMDMQFYWIKDWGSQFFSLLGIQYDK